MRRTNQNWTARQVVSMINKGTITFDNPVQRPSDQWDYKKKSLLIHSLITMFVPEIYSIVSLKDVNGKEVKTYDIIDGKQRLNAVNEFLSDGLVLEGVSDIVLEDTGETFEVNGLRYSDLPEALKEAVDGYSFTFKNIELDEEDDEEGIVDEIFYRLNNGTPVSKQHLAYISTDRSIQEFVREIVENHALFTQVAHFAKGAMKNSDKHMTVMQTIALLSELEFKSFSAKHIEEFFKENVISDDVKIKVEEAFDKLANTFQEYNKFVQKIHIPIMSKLAHLDGFNDFILNYSQVSEKGDGYRRFCGAGCTKRENVNGRIEGMKKYYDEFVVSEQKTA